MGPVSGAVMEKAWDIAPVSGAVMVVGAAWAAEPGSGEPGKETPAGERVFPLLRDFVIIRHARGGGHPGSRRHQ